MAVRRTSLSTYEVLTLLSAQFPNQITNLDPIKGGTNSQAFSFEAGGDGYVVRFQVNGDGFIKDKYAFEHFSSVKIPIPEVLRTGQVQGGYFAISRKLPGKDLRDTGIKNNLGLLKDMFEVMNAIHNIPLPEGAKYGFWNKNGEAEFSIYSHFEFRDELSVKKEGGGFYSWEDVYKIPGADKELLEKLKSEAKNRIKFLSPQNSLVHGDFGFSNLLADETKVTGVLDWSESFYGDFLYDTAWLDFWSKDVDFTELYRRYYQEMGIEVPNYENRLMFHKLLIGRSSLAIAALREDFKDYQEVKDIILDFL